MSTFPEYIWREIPSEAYRKLVEGLGFYSAMKTFGVITDLSGQHGAPLIMTEWGPKEAAYPLVKHERNPDVPGSEKFFVAIWIESHA